MSVLIAPSSDCQRQHIRAHFSSCGGSVGTGEELAELPRVTDTNLELEYGHTQQ